MSTGVPGNDPKDYNPKAIGTRPAYGWYLHNADNVQFTDSSVKFAANDGRPAVIANAASGIRFTGFTAQRGSNSPYDLGFQDVNGYCVSGAGAPRVSSIRLHRELRDRRDQHSRCDRLGREHPPARSRRPPARPGEPPPGLPPGLRRQPLPALGPAHRARPHQLHRLGERRHERRLDPRLLDQRGPETAYAIPGTGDLPQPPRLRPTWPSKIPGSCSTERDFLGELITAAKAKGMKVVLYMTDDPQWHDEGGHEWLDSAAYSRLQGQDRRPDHPRRLRTVQLRQLLRGHGPLSRPRRLLDRQRQRVLESPTSLSRSTRSAPTTRSATTTKTRRSWT
ncbi:hypothetical protein ACRAWF_17340 [Streptomyces sp. L7]